MDRSPAVDESGSTPEVLAVEPAEEMTESEVQRESLAEWDTSLAEEDENYGDELS
jgi:hypothetical protein